MPKTPLLPEAELIDALRSLPLWRRSDGQIERTFRAASFPDVIRLVEKVAVLAEEADHHPDIDIRYRDVTFRLSTHDSGGITRLDVDLAIRIDQAAAR